MLNRCSMKQCDRSSDRSLRNEGNESACFCRRNNHCLGSFKKNNNKKNYHLYRDGTALKWIFSYSISYRLFLIRCSEDHNVTFIGFHNLVCYLNGKMVYTLCLRCAPRKTVWFLLWFILWWTTNVTWPITDKTISIPGVDHCLTRAYLIYSFSFSI